MHRPAELRHPPPGRLEQKLFRGEAPGNIEGFGESEIESVALMIGAAHGMDTSITILVKCAIRKNEKPCLYDDVGQGSNVSDLVEAVEHCGKNLKKLLPEFTEKTKEN